MEITHEKVLFFMKQLLKVDFFISKVDFSIFS